MTIDQHHAAADIEVPTTTADRIADLERRRAQARQPGSVRALERQRASGRLTSRERIALLLDEGSFVEYGELVRHRNPSRGMAENRPPGDGVVTGYGRIDGRTVCVIAHDFTVFGGSMGEAFGEKVCRIMDLALSIGCPIVSLNDSGGARIQEGVVSLAYYAEVGRRNVLASGVIPQITLVMGPCAGGAVYSPALTDFIVMVDGTSHMFVTGPEVIQAVTGERTTVEDLGGGMVNSTLSGNAHHLAGSEEEALAFVRDLLSYLPANNAEDPPVEPGWPLEPAAEEDPALDGVIPDAPHEVYDMRDVIVRVLDEDSLLGYQDLFAPNMICCFGRLAGRPVGVVANQPTHLAGALDINASEKAARFIRFCDAFNLPVITFVDVPGYLPGTDQERQGIIHRGAKIVFAYCEATVPLITVVTRKAYGGGYGVMGSKHLGVDVNLAWPTAEIAVMGAQSAIGLLHRRELAASDDPEALRAKLVAEYQQTLATPYVAADRGYVDAVIRPSETRAHLIAALQTLGTKRVDRPAKKHGNIPL